MTHTFVLRIRRQARAEILLFASHSLVNSIRSLPRLARTSRTRVTAIMNRNTKDISTDLLLRVLYALGYTAKITLQRAA
jgi:hypothetical protein